MVCKEDVVSWFKELESYKRIDAMCTLLNMCLPFELRFIGTYLEELGKRDFQELRGAELRANNPTDLAADIGGANTDPRTRRKMALYVSLLRSCNFVCATTLYNAMVSLEQSGLIKGLYGDLLEEILLLYTMALHHPAFTFDQKSHFGDILEKLKIEEHRLPYPEIQDHVNIPSMSSCISQSSVVSGMSMPPPMQTLGPPPTLMYVKSPNVQGSISSNEQGRLDELGSPPVIPPPATSGVVPVCEVTHLPPGLPIPPQYNMPEYVVNQHTWPGNIIVQHLPQPLEVLNYPPPAQTQSSPLMSSPNDSRGGSPRPRRRVSRERSPPPAPPDQPPPLTQLAANLENLTVNDIRCLEDDQLREFGMPLSAVQQLRALTKMNGIRRIGGVAPRSSSDSGSSAASSPPGTPAPRRSTPSAPPGLSYMHYPRYSYPVAFRGPSPYVNGEPAPAYPSPFGGFVPMLYAPPKVSCFNCGSAGHAGHECKEPSMEEMTRAGGYQLDFGAPPDTDK